MVKAVITYLPWLLSAITVYTNLLAGDNKRAAWSLGLVNQALWLVWIVMSQTWGLIPLNAALWVVFARNYRKWSVRA